MSKNEGNYAPQGSLSMKNLVNRTVEKWILETDVDW